MFMLRRKMWSMHVPPIVVGNANGWCWSPNCVANHVANSCRSLTSMLISPIRAIGTSRSTSRFGNEAHGRHLVVVSRCYGNAASLLLSHVAMVTTVVLYVTYACLWRNVISCLTICRLRGDVTFLCSDPQSNRNQRRCHVKSGSL